MCGEVLTVFVAQEADRTSQVLSNSCGKVGREEHWEVVLNGDMQEALNADGEQRRNMSAWTGKQTEWCGAYHCRGL